MLKYFESPNFQLQRGAVLPIARLAYRTVGQLNEARDNVVLIPSWYSGNDDESEWVFGGKERPLGSEGLFVVYVNLLGGGRSSSPSNTPYPYDRARFPTVTLYDNVRLQHELLTSEFDIKKIRLVTGWSMGGAQAYQWGALYPDMVERVAPVAASARTSSYNRAFLYSMKRAIQLDPVFDDGYYSRPPINGIKLFASIYAGWGVSEPFFREKTFGAFGAENNEEFVKFFWEPAFLKHDANDLLAQLSTWESADISDNPVFKKDFAAALSAIKARTIMSPVDQDRIFPPVDSFAEIEKIAHGECSVISSTWGHMAPLQAETQKQIDVTFSRLLSVN